MLKEKEAWWNQVNFPGFHWRNCGAKVDPKSSAFLTSKSLGSSDHVWEFPFPTPFITVPSLSVSYSMQSHSWKPCFYTDTLEGTWIWQCSFGMSKYWHRYHFDNFIISCLFHRAKTIQGISSDILREFQTWDYCHTNTEEGISINGPILLLSRNYTIFFDQLLTYELKALKIDVQISLLRNIKSLEKFLRNK